MTLQLPRLLFLIGIILLCLLIIVFIVLINLPQEEGSGNDILPTPTSVPGQLRSGSSTIEPEKISPSEDISGQTIKNPSQKITYSLSERVSPNEISVRVSPTLPVKVQQGSTPSEIIVFPDPPEFWRPNILYTITLLDSNAEVITSYQIKVPPIEIDQINEAEAPH